MLECHVHNGRGMKPHVFWGSEAFLIVSMGHSFTLVPLGLEKACYYHLKMEISISIVDTVAKWRILCGFSSHQV